MANDKIQCHSLECSVDAWPQMICTCGARPSADPINSPAHYRWLPVEAIEITELFNFRLGNALKYILRADHKGRPIEDLKKSLWYLTREIEAREREAKSE